MLSFEWKRIKCGKYFVFLKIIFYQSIFYYFQTLERLKCGERSGVQKIMLGKRSVSAHEGECVFDAAIGTGSETVLFRMVLEVTCTKLIFIYHVKFFL
jgi:hypothetical protein